MELSILQCPQCGGEINLSEDKKSGKCLSCEAVFHYKKEKSAEKIGILNQANFCRRRNDFEGAIMLYNDVLRLDETDSEAYWGLVLSTYGIEYIPDARSGANIATCRRIVSHSIFHDKNYLKAIEHAENSQKNVYRQEALRIDDLQQSIKVKLERESEYDVFLCFKSTDEYGFPTEDRYIARRIYDELSKRGIKTFYSEITLKDKLGSEYEPIIYKALYTCKVMILIATREEYVNAVWVRNEWSRFRDRVHEENMQNASFAVFKDLSTNALPPIFRTQGVDLRKYPFGGYEIEIADALTRRFKARPAYAENFAQDAHFYGTKNYSKTAESAAYAGAAAAAAGAQFAGTQAQQNYSRSDSYSAGQAKPKTSFIDDNLPKEEVIKAANKLVQNKASVIKARDRAVGKYNVNKTSMKKTAQQRQALLKEKMQIEQRLADPGYYKKEARRKANKSLGVCIFLTMMLFVFAAVIVVNASGFFVFLMAALLFLIWARQIWPIRKKRIAECITADREREKVVKEQLIQCEIQLANINSKFDKAQKEMDETEDEINEIDEKLQEISEKYDYAGEYIEKAQRSIPEKVADAVSEGIRGIGNGIEQGIRSVKEMFKNQ